MKLAHLRTFVSIVDSGGVARAASRMNLTQSAASRQIGALEAELGITLFDRIGRRVHLTAEGEDLLRHCRRVLVEAESVEERARALKSGRASGVLRVGATPQVIENLVADFLIRYRGRHPGIEVRLVEEGGARLPGRLERGDVQLAIMPHGDSEFRARLLYPMYVLAVLPVRHRLGRRGLLEVTDLANEPVLRLSKTFASHLWFEAACQVAHVRPRVLLESGAPQALIALARTGHGVAIVPTPVRIPRDGVRVVPLVHRGSPIGQWATVAWDPRRFLSQAAEQFATELVAQVRRKYPGSDHTRHAPPLPRPKEPIG
jgi:DNA-binding transcriptional LysR family regulator